MLVRELIEILKGIDQRAHVVINHTEISGVEEMTGRLRPVVGTPNMEFMPTPKGRDQAVTFTHFTENSAGEQSLSRYWHGSPHD